MTTRRECLKQGGMAAATLAAAGCGPITRGLSQPALDPDWSPSAAPAGNPAAVMALRRTISRTSLGPRPGELKRTREIGLDAYLEEQLHPEHLDESPAVAWRLW